MRNHLAALIVLERVWGGFAAITSASLAVLAAGVAASPLPSGTDPAGRGAVLVLSTCAATVAAGGLGAFAVARGLRRRQAAGRRAALILAIPNLLVVPFGTALGVYTCWVLLNNDARREFGRPPRGAAAVTIPPAR